MPPDNKVKTLTYTDILQLQHSGGVVGLDVFRQQRDQEACVSEGHLPLLRCGPVLSALLLSGEKGDMWSERLNKVTSDNEVCHEADAEGP